MGKITFFNNLLSIQETGECGERMKHTVKLLVPELSLGENGSAT
jgi:hypothetical protein